MTAAINSTDAVFVKALKEPPGVSFDNDDNRPNPFSFSFSSPFSSFSPFLSFSSSCFVDDNMSITSIDLQCLRSVRDNADCSSASVPIERMGMTGPNQMRPVHPIHIDITAIQGVAPGDGVIDEYKLL